MDSDYIGVKYYNNMDMSTGWNLGKAEKVINNFDKSINFDNINYILELININSLFETDVKLKIWTDEYYKEMKNIVKEFKSIIGRYFSTLDYEKLQINYSIINTYYRDTFWENFVYYKIWKKLSSEEFSKFIIENKIQLHYILSQKEIVKNFDIEISNYMEHNKSTAEILIEHHLVKKEKNDKQYFIPESLVIDKQMIIIKKYINSDDANPNYLELLYKARNTKEFPIPDELRLNAKKRYEKFLETVSLTETGFNFGATVGFANINEITKNSNDDISNLERIYSRNWLKENLDNATLLNNFIYLTILICILELNFHLKKMKLVF